MRTYKATLYSLFPSKSVWEQSHVGSNPTRCATSEQAMYRLLRLFLKVRARSRRCSSSPHRNRLRWVAMWVRRYAAVFFLSQGNTDFDRPFPNERTFERMSFHLEFRQPKGGLRPSVFQCSGWQSHPCAKVFAYGKNACTAHSRRRPRRAAGHF